MSNYRITEKTQTNFYFNDDVDFRKDANRGDPDSKSPTLKKYHRFFWSRILPNGKVLDLDENLNQKSNWGDFSFSSDCIIHSFSRWNKYQHIIKEIPEEELEEFRRMGYTFGGMIIFPRNKINNKPTINMARGCSAKICDRFDLTLECIRRHYINELSPLTDVFERYRSFFDLFIDFKGYVDFFFLNDLVLPDYSGINFYQPFDEFISSPLPATVDDYLIYKENNINFINNRNKRIQEWINCIK